MGGSPISGLKRLTGVHWRHGLPPDRGKALGQYNPANVPTSVYIPKHMALLIHLLPPRGQAVILSPWIGFVFVI